MAAAVPTGAADQSHPCKTSDRFVAETREQSVLFVETATRGHLREISPAIKWLVLLVGASKHFIILKEITLLALQTRVFLIIFLNHGELLYSIPAR